MRAQKNGNGSAGSRLSVAVVGGGIGGLALAICLSQEKSLNVHLFEAAPKFAEIGAGISFGTNAVRSLAKMGLEEPYRQIADTTPEPFEDIWFEWRRSCDQSYLCATKAPGCGQSSVHRADFLDALVAHLPQGVAHFGKRCTTIEQRDERARVIFDDGDSFDCDVVIGCDGIKSAVRGHVLSQLDGGDLSPRFTHTLAYRGLVRTDELKASFAKAGVDTHLAVVPQMYLGCGKHLLTFPVKKGELTNVVAFVTDPTITEAQLPAGIAGGAEVSQAAMLSAFAEFGSAPTAVLQCIAEPSLWAMYELPELPRYARERVLIMGDAAHAMLPHQGAGAGQALEDAYVLSRLLTDRFCTRANVPQVLDVFDVYRRPRACQVQRTSREAGDVYQYRGAGIADKEERLVCELTKRYDWIWDYDPEETVRAATQALGWGVSANVM